MQFELELLILDSDSKIAAAHCSRAEIKQCVLLHVQSKT